MNAKGPEVTRGLFHAVKEGPLPVFPYPLRGEGEVSDSQMRRRFTSP